VKQVMLGDEGVASFLKPGSTFIDMSSINPMASREIAEVLTAKGVEMLDAPVSGGEPKAIDGTLSIMVGGKQDVFDRLKPILATMGASVVRCGDIGAGNTTKLANQIVVALNIAACSEAFTLARMAGVDPALVFEAIKGGLAGSTVMNFKVPMMLRDDFKPGFKIDLHIKDLCNALDCGHAIGAPLPLTAQVMEMMENLHFDGKGADDHSSLANYYAKISGVKIAK
jgi:2-hydroxy-3-oxopropionate reductase